MNEAPREKNRTTDPKRRDFKPHKHHTGPKRRRRNRRHSKQQRSR